MSYTKEQRIVNASKPKAVNTQSTPIGAIGGSPLIIPNHSGMSTHPELVNFLLTEYLRLDGGNSMSGRLDLKLDTNQIKFNSDGLAPVTLNTTTASLSGVTVAFNPLANDTIMLLGKQQTITANKTYSSGVKALFGTVGQVYTDGSDLLLISTGKVISDSIFQSTKLQAYNDANTEFNWTGDGVTLTLGGVDYIVASESGGVVTSTIGGSSDVTAVGSSGSSLGFYGTTPTTQQTLSTGSGATVDNVITALQNLGLVKQS